MIRNLIPSELYEDVRFVRGRRAWTLAGCLFVAEAMAILYRAATQAIVHDEAATYHMFIAGPLDHVFTRYTANNHVLFTFLANVTTAAFGVSELALRLPSIIAGIGYLIVAALLARRICTHSWLFLLTYCALTVNPLIFDFFSAARGYGLALFLFMLGLLEVSREPGQRRWMFTSLALAGSVCANLAFLFPVLAVWITVSAIIIREQSTHAVISKAIVRLWMPGVTAATAFLAVPLHDASREYFFFGSKSLTETGLSLVLATVRHHPTWLTETSWAVWIERSLLGVAFFVVAAALSGGASVAMKLKKEPIVLSRILRWQLLLAGTWALTLGLLVAAHVFENVPYPKDRTGIYMIPLAILSAAALIEGSRHDVIRICVVCALLVLALASVEQFTVRSYGEWRYDAGSRRIAEIIAAWSKERGKPVKVAATMWLYQPALDFYRAVLFSDWITSVSDGYDPEQIHEYDVLVLNDDDAAKINPSWCRLYVDRVSRAQVFVAEGTSQAVYTPATSDFSVGFRVQVPVNVKCLAFKPGPV